MLLGPHPLCTTLMLCHYLLAPGLALPAAFLLPGTDSTFQRHLAHLRCFVPCGWSCQL